MNLDALKSQLDSLKSTNTKSEKKDFSTIYWKPTVGKQFIRIVPSKYTPDNPFTSLKIYYNIGNKVMLSPLNTGGADPIAEFTKKVRAQEYSKENYFLAKKLDPKTRYFAPVIVRGEEDKGVRLWQFGKMIYEELLSLALDEEVGDFTDVSDGRDFTIETVGPEVTGTSYNKSSVRPKMKTTPLSEDASKVDLWLEEQPKPIDQFKVYEFDEMKEALGRWLDPDVADAPPSTPASTAPKVEASPSYALNTNKVKETKADNFDSLFGNDNNDDLPF